MLVWGFPVFYMPYFSSPELHRQQADRRRWSAPQFVSGGYLGYGISIPYFINLGATI